MATLATPRIQSPKAHPRAQFVLNDQIRIPADIHDLESFRRWCRSSDYPERGDVFWFGGTFWVNNDMEQAYTHSLIQLAIATALTTITQHLKNGHVFGDRMRFSNTATDVSCEPDVMFISLETIRNKRVRQIPAETGGVIEFEGSPDIVVEVVSESSEDKDEEMKDRYFSAGIQEYWIADGRREMSRFEIFRRGETEYETTPADGGWVRSEVLRRSFQLVREADEFGNPTFRLAMSDELQSSPA